MQIIKDINEVKFDETAVAMGAFDGIHLGHQAIISQMVAYAKEHNLPSVVLTFDPHPRSVVSPHFKLELLTTLDEKIELIAKLGVEYILLLKFNQKLQKTTFTNFVRSHLVDGLKVKNLFVGYDHGFGYERSGDVSGLRDLGKEYRFEVTVIPPVTIEQEAVKSSIIRRLISRGKVDLAAKFLGHPYFLRGKVVKGKGRGKTIKPTANLDVDPRKILPEEGVYVAQTVNFGQVLPSVVNVGRRPTFSEKNVTVEVHILDYDRLIYGEDIEVQFLKKLRNEIKFSDAGALKMQIEKDIAKARRYAFGF